MSELLPMLETLVADAEAQRPVAVCTVLKTKGSTPQCPGASMLVRGDYSTLGTLGGGCVEAEVRKQAFQLLQRGESGLLDYLLNHDYGWDDGLICGGRMFVGVQPLADAALLPAYRAALDCARAGRPAEFPLRIVHDGAMQEYRVTLEAPPTLLIAGAGHVGRALAKLMIDLDFDVHVIDDRADCASAEHLPAGTEAHVGDIAGFLREWPMDEGCYVVIVTRGHQHDHQALAAAIRHEVVGYIGLIGSKRKRRMIFDDLRAAGVPQARLDDVHSPIGLDIGAITVREIALSIAAELVEHRRAAAPELVRGPFPVSAAAADLPSPRASSFT